MEQDKEERWMPGLRPVLVVVAGYLIVRLLNWWAGGAAPWEQW